MFESAVRAVFSRWTLLRLAIDEGWSDGDPTMLANSLLQDLLSLLISDKKIYRDQVEDLLFDTLESKVKRLIFREEL